MGLRERQRLIRRENILAAASDLFAAHSFNEVSLEAVDVALNDTMVAASLIKKADSGFVTAGEPFAPQEQAVAMRKDPALKAAIDKAIEEMKADGTLTAMSIKWLGVDVSK